MVASSLGAMPNGAAGGGWCQQIEAADKQHQLVLFEGVVARLGHNYGGMRQWQGQLFPLPTTPASPQPNAYIVGLQRGLAIDLAIEAKHKARI